MTTSLRDCRIVVTGSRGDLGRAIVMDLAGHGARIAGIDRQAAPADAHADTHQPSLAVAELTGNLTDAAETGRVMQQAAAALGGIDVLINSAGLIFSRPLVNILASADQQRHSLADWHRVLDANLTTTFNATSRAVQYMLQNRIRGTIVNMSSVSAAGTAGQSAYAAAKAGVEALTRVWAKEYGGLGLRVVAIAPGYIDTASTHQAMNERLLRHIAGETPLKRLGSTEDICRTIRFVIESPFLTGQVIAIDGGLTA